MKLIKIVIAVVLWTVVVGLAYWLYTEVDGPVTFRAEQKIRTKATQNRLLDIKVAQEYYKEKNNTYASNFDDLINTIKNEKLEIIKIIGDPDDTTIVTTYDTIQVPILEEIKNQEEFKGTDDINQLRYVPFSDNKTFELAMDTIKVQRVKLTVFEAKTTKEIYLEGLDEKFIKNPNIADLSIGSLTSASGKGSWE